MTQHKLRNLKITCSWNGKGFSGYQRQPHAVTIEETLCKTWKLLTGEKTDIIGCSRLDAGVHAHHYVFNVHSGTKFSTERIVKSLNGILHTHFNVNVCIYSCEEVDSTFHARFSAVGKHYQYLIWHGFSAHSEYLNRAWHIKTKNSLENFETILKQFEGTHNFNSFRASDCGSKNVIKTIHKITVTNHTEFPELWIVDIFGDGFLKNMIRNMVGMGMLVINEKKQMSDICERLKDGKKDYNLCAPSCGLTLMQVYYNLEHIKQT